MRINKPKLLKAILWLGAAYYLIGAAVHWFVLTLFPFYDARLYAPYHDPLVALASLMFAFFIAIIAHDPVKNIDTLRVVIAGAYIGSLFSVLIIYKVDFAALGAPEKALQTVVEGVVGFIFAGLLLWLYPHAAPAQRHNVLG